MKSEPKKYSAQWFEFFHAGIDEARTNREIEFIRATVPRPEFQRILDVCCGMGRHARALSSLGYSLVGVDRDAQAISTARELQGGPEYVQADIRDYRPGPTKFDASIVMGQSFGHFDHSANQLVLSQIANCIRDGGRVVLDLWNPDFFVAHQGERELKTSQGNVREIKRVEADRLSVELDYPDGTQEKFEWQLFSPAQMERLAAAAGLHVLHSCSGFDSKNPPAPGDPRLQFVLES